MNRLVVVPREVQPPEVAVPVRRLEKERPTGGRKAVVPQVQPGHIVAVSALIEEEMDAVVAEEAAAKAQLAEVVLVAQETFEAHHSHHPKGVAVEDKDLETGPADGD